LHPDPDVMGRVHAYTSSTSTTRVAARPIVAVLRVVERALAGVALVLTLPLLAVVALAVRQSSHGPVLHREPGYDRGGRAVNLLTFRTTLDGAGTEHHARLRAVIGSDGLPVTRVGRLLRSTRLDRLPRLLNVVAGHSGRF
jgi:lipopolysaccharide/colanic/teichoic acid biosynthesis glycosyltransferase